METDEAFALVKVKDSNLNSNGQAYSEVVSQLQTRSYSRNDVSASRAYSHITHTDKIKVITLQSKFCKIQHLLRLFKFITQYSNYIVVICKLQSLHNCYMRVTQWPSKGTLAVATSICPQWKNISTLSAEIHATFKNI